MKIALANYWHDDNKGDCGIIWGMIESILHNYPNARISLISTFSEDDPRYKNSFRHLQRRFHSINVFGSPIERMDAYNIRIPSKKFVQLRKVKKSLWEMQYVKYF